MINIDVSGLPEVQRALRTAADQVPFALSKAINATAFKVRTAEQGELQAKLDRPTPFIVKGVFVEKSTKQTLTATISPGDERNRGAFTRRKNIVGRNFIGGQRDRSKAIEKKLVALGWMPSGWVAVPTQFIRLDARGNISMATWRDMLNEANPGARGKYFVAHGTGRTAHLAPGIWRRVNRNHRMVPLVLFWPRARYQRLLDWEGQARRTVAVEFPTQFSAAFAQALRTRRP